MLTVGVPTVCRSCGAGIVWMTTANSKRMPVDLTSCEPGETIFVHGKHISHFSTCPHADQWRKRKR